VAQNGVIELECSFNIFQRFRTTLDVHQNIVGLVNLVDGISQMATAPVFKAMDRAITGLNHFAIFLNHRGDLLALVRMDHEHDFVVSHWYSLWLIQPPITVPETGCGEARRMATAFCHP
jgi:hypothetical protein